MTKRAEILNELKEITTVADRFSAETPYRLPDGYFEQLADGLLKRVKAEEAVSAVDELLILSPLLGKLDKKMPFTVPDNYFNSLPADSLKQANGVQEGKVVPLSFTKKFFRYSMAAAVAGIIAVSAWFLIKSPAETELTVAQDVLKNVKNISDGEINDYLEASTGTAVYQAAPAEDDIKDEDVKLMLADISDDELQYYVEQDNSVLQILN